MTLTLDVLRGFASDLDMRTTVEEAVRIRALTNDKRQEGIQSIAKYLTQVQILPH